MRRLITSDQVMPFVASRLQCSLASSCAQTAVGVSGVGERSYDREVLYGRDSDEPGSGRCWTSSSSHSGALVISGGPASARLALLTDARERAVDCVCWTREEGSKSESNFAFAGCVSCSSPFVAIIGELPARRRRPSWRPWAGEP